MLETPDVTQEAHNVARREELETERRAYTEKIDSLEVRGALAMSAIALRAGQQKVVLRQASDRFPRG